MNNKTRILIIWAGIFLLWAYGYTKAEPEYVWVTEEKYDHISSILFTADSNYIVINGRKVNSTEQCYTIIDVDNGRVAKEVIGEGHIFAFTKDGRYAYSFKNIINQKQMIYKLSASTLTPYDSINMGNIIKSITSLALSADNKRIYVTNFNPQLNPEQPYTIIVLDAQNLEMNQGKELSQGSDAIAVSPHNDFIAIYNYYFYGQGKDTWGEARIELYNAHTLELVKSFKLGEKRDLREMQFSNDGRYFASITKTRDNTINDEMFIYDVKNEFNIVYNIKNEGQINSLTFLPNRNTFYASFSDMTYSYFKEITIGSNEATCIYNLFDNGIHSPFIFTKNQENMLVRPRDIYQWGYLTMVKNPCYEGTNVTETGENKEIKSIIVIDNKISIPIDNHVITNPINWQIHDIIGNQVLSGIEHSVTNELQIDVSILPSGTYFLSLQFEKETVNYKFMIVS